MRGNNVVSIHEPVPNRVLNPNASEASYKPKKYSVFSGGNIPWGNILGWNVPGVVYLESIKAPPKTRKTITAPSH